MDDKTGHRGVPTQDKKDRAPIFDGGADTENQATSTKSTEVRTYGEDTPHGAPRGADKDKRHTLSTADVVRILGKSKRTVGRYIADGRLTCERHITSNGGYQNYFCKSEVEMLHKKITYTHSGGVGEREKSGRQDMEVGARQDTPTAPTPNAEGAPQADNDGETVVGVLKRQVQGLEKDKETYMKLLQQKDDYILQREE